MFGSVSISFLYSVPASAVGRYDRPFNFNGLDRVSTGYFDELGTMLRVT